MSTLIALFGLALLAALTAWGWTVRAMVLRIERAHPAFAEDLRMRAARKPARMAIASELQKALGQGEALPPDPALTAAAARERRLRTGLIFLAPAFLLALFLA
ncbi:hypothetical protein [Albimonas pacifica]|uniref:Uncharacterized protein n=1 Tax=Albimonas pacifica TaxID=1114924 RepID=A0A1I3LX88_9RHOB|nr:hypothetical protein [Albimonas pacifica]SFI89115.1 hypothetical protein SAMN05216258_110208 [Albimonas pacifica]